MNKIFYSFDQLKAVSKVGRALKCDHCGIEIWVAVESENEANTIARAYGWRIGSRGCYCPEHRSVKLRREDEEEIREITGRTPLEYYERVRQINKKWQKHLNIMEGKYGKKDN